MVETSKQLSLRIDSELDNMLNALAKLYDLNKSQIIRIALREKHNSKATKLDRQVSERIRTRLDYCCYLIRMIKQAALDEQLAWIEKLEEELMKYGS